MGTLLEIRNLTKIISGKKVIDNLSLAVNQGDIHGFLGRNGQGKTTTIRLITGLVYPNSGEVVINGHNLHKDFKNAISHVGAIVESPSFHEYLTGYDNLKLMANLMPILHKRTAIQEALEIVGLSARAKDKVKTYSLGMKQRLGIAGALLGNPELVILDEPTNGLDPQGMREMKEIITQLASERNITFFISSHLLHEIEQICNRVSIINQGKVLTEVDMTELKSQGKTLEETYFHMTGSGGGLA